MAFRDHIDVVIEAEIRCKGCHDFVSRERQVLIAEALDALQGIERDLVADAKQREWVEEEGQMRCQNCKST